MAKEVIILLLALSLIISEFLFSISYAVPTEISESDKAYAEMVANGQEIVMPVGQFPVYVKEGDRLIIFEDGSTSLGRMSGGKMILFGMPINVNTASEDDFDDIPGIGSETASRIVAFRNKEGEFSSLEDLREVNGIGPKTLERIRQYLTL